MKPVVLQSSALEASISPLGAELRGLKHLPSGSELLWNGDPTHWKGVSPILFPVVGRLRGDKYVWQGRSYSLPQHGFARELEWDVVHEDEQSASFLLAHAGPFLERYPQEFQLASTYSIDGSGLDWRIDVFNPSATDDLLFSVGAHPAFRWPLRPDGSQEGHSLHFDRPETCDRLEVDIDGLLTGRKVPFFREQENLRLRPDLFRAGAVVLEGLKSESVTLGSEDGARVKFIAPGASWWGFWTRPSAPFLCLEPWHGVADRADADWDLRAKPGIIALPAGESWSWSMRIEISGF